MKTAAAYLLLSLSGAVSGTDIIGYVAESCDGAYGQCSNIGPRACCEAVQGLQGAQSAGFLYLPSSAHLVGYQQDQSGNQCAVVLSSFIVDAGSYCLSENENFGQYAGLSYFFPDSPKSRRSRSIEECVERVRMDRIVLKDGTRFNIKSLSDEMAGQLWQLAGDGATKATIPEEFQEFEMTE